MQPYVLHESTKSTKGVFMDTNFVYLQHAAVCPTWIYEIDHMCIMDTNFVYTQYAAVCPTWIYEIEHMYMYGY